MTAQRSKVPATMLLTSSPGISRFQPKKVDLGDDSSKRTHISLHTSFVLGTINLLMVPCDYLPLSYWATGAGTRPIVWLFKCP